jgi:rare lipoprotein A
MTTHERSGWRMRIGVLACLCLATGCANVVPPRPVAAPQHGGHPAGQAPSRGEPPSAPAALPPPSGPASERGVASYYSDKLTGRSTASGEPYDPRGFTAAHRTLPFGTWLEVRRGERAVRVRVNDRGPFARGRVIDLSRAAAEALGIVRAGVAEVELFVLGRQAR